MFYVPSFCFDIPPRCQHESDDTSPSPVEQTDTDPHLAMVVVSLEAPDLTLNAPTTPCFVSLLDGPRAFLSGCVLSLFLCCVPKAGVESSDALPYPAMWRRPGVRWRLRWW